MNLMAALLLMVVAGGCGYGSLEVARGISQCEGSQRRARVWLKVLGSAIFGLMASVYVIRAQAQLLDVTGVAWLQWTFYPTGGTGPVLRLYPWAPLYAFVLPSLALAVRWRKQRAIP